jgi:hypothetical protein
MYLCLILIYTRKNKKSNFLSMHLNEFDKDEDRINNKMMNNNNKS